MDMAALFFRTLFVYIIVFATMKIMGKRELARLSLVDFVISIMIAEIAVFVIEDIDKPLRHGIIPLATLVLIQFTFAFLSLKSETIRRWFSGKPSLLIRNGKLDREEMRNQRYNLDDLMMQLRQNKVTNMADVEFAVLEPSGELTVVKKNKQNNERPLYRFEGLPVPLIMDGKVQDDHLQKLGQTRFWLKSELRRHGVNDFKEVFFCSIDHRGKLFIDRKKPD